jgi:hypothetical protein
MADKKKNKGPSKNDGPPTLCATEPGGAKRELQLAFGYMEGEPCAALFVNGSDEPILLPRDFLQIAIEQGWRMQ